MRLLLEAHADPTWRYASGKTALELARDQGHHDVVRLLTDIDAAGDHIVVGGRDKAVAMFDVSGAPKAEVLQRMPPPAAEERAPIAPIAQAPQAHLGFQGGYGSGRGAPPLPHVIASSNGPNNGPNGARGGPPGSR